MDIEKLENSSAELKGLMTLSKLEGSIVSSVEITTSNESPTKTLLKNVLRQEKFKVLDEHSIDDLWDILISNEHRFTKARTKGSIVVMQNFSSNRVSGVDRVEVYLSLFVIDTINRKVNEIPKAFTTKSQYSSGYFTTNVFTDIMTKYRVSIHEAFFILLMSNGLQGNYLTDEDGWEELLKTVDNRPYKKLTEGMYTSLLEHGQGSRALASEELFNVATKYNIRHLKSYSNSTWGGTANMLHLKRDLYNQPLASSIMYRHFGVDKEVFKIDSIEMDYKNNVLKAVFKAMSERSMAPSLTDVVGQVLLHIEADLNNADHLWQLTDSLSSRYSTIVSKAVGSEVRKLYPELGEILTELCVDKAMHTFDKVASSNYASIGARSISQRGYAKSFKGIRDVSLLANYYASTLDNISINRDSHASGVVHYVSSRIKDYVEARRLDLNSDAGKINNLLIESMKLVSSTLEDMGVTPPETADSVFLNNYATSTVVNMLLWYSNNNKEAFSKDLVQSLNVSVYDNSYNYDVYDHSPSNLELLVYGANIVPKSVAIKIGEKRRKVLSVRGTYSTKSVEQVASIIGGIYDKLVVLWADNVEVVSKLAYNVLDSNTWTPTIDFKPKKAVMRGDWGKAWHSIKNSNSLLNILTLNYKGASGRGEELLDSLSTPNAKFSLMSYLTQLDTTEVSDIVETTDLRNNTIMLLTRTISLLVEKVNISPVKLVELIKYVLEDTINRQRIRSVSSAVQYYYDYLVAYDKLVDNGLRSYDRFDVTPFSLVLAHDIFTYEEGELSTRLNDEIFKTRYEEVSTMEDLWNTFIVDDVKYKLTYPKEVADLKHEGNTLNHCVGGYASRIINEECLIMFLRPEEDMDKPYVTVEFVIRKGDNGKRRYSLGQVQGSNSNNTRGKITKFKEALKPLPIMVTDYEGYLAKKEEGEKEKRLRREATKEEAK